MNREEFKRFAAGQFVIGKPSIDTKELEVYVNGAVFAFDEINKKGTTTKVQHAQGVIIEQPELQHFKDRN